ncbi:MAG: cryptochrome/photolyase family protein [Alkalispirochaeta sp.]
MTPAPPDNGQRTAVLVYPHQLYRAHPAIERAPGAPVFLVEDPLFFRQYSFARVPLAYHRLTMEAYRRELLDRGHRVTIIPGANLAGSHEVFRHLPASVRRVFTGEPDDDWLRQALDRGAQTRGLTVEYVESPGFLLPRARIDHIGTDGDPRSDRMAPFYRMMRTELQVLLTPEGGPQGGKWNFDTDNRKKIPRGMLTPSPVSDIHSAAARDAASHLNEELPPYPITAADTDRWLHEFIDNRLDLFGPYEDALDQRDDRWYHALLTPMLNAGLTTPRHVLDAILDHADRRARGGHPIPFNSLEGFIRQLIGWREFMRTAYHLHGRTMRTTNFWNHTRSMPEAFYRGTTGLPPVDEVISKVQRTGWAHHIERLMILGNVMLLCEIDPDAVYQWFMELFVDAYDWVMVPNVYGMSQYADGGLITTKPYISGSNYIRKMSHYPAGPWQDTWDGLYWRFIDRHREVFNATPRLSLMPRRLNQLQSDRREKIFRAADRFLDRL